MSISSRRISCRRWLIAVAVAVFVLSAGGCEEFLSPQQSGAQSQSIIEELSKIEPTPEPNIPIPEIYTQPPEIAQQTVSGKTEWKLFYFCKYHTSDEMQKIVHEQFATVIFNEKGKGETKPDYTVSSSPATNQLIVRCPAKEDIEAVLQTLQKVDVPPIQVKIDCLVSEIYADKTLDHETTIAIENLFGEHVTLTPGGLPFGADVQQLIDEGGEVLPAFPGASLRDIARARMGLKVGYLSTSHEFTALVDLLESKGYLKILMHPTLEVVNGKTAKVMKSEHVPLQKITRNVPLGGVVVLESETEYIDVVDSLEITPHVFADRTIGLETTILLGSKLTPEGVKQLPIVSKKEIENKENRIRRGESLVIGGIRKTEKRDVVRGVPFLKDIPLLGILFSGRDYEERVVETIFILTPTISTGGIPKAEMVEEVKRKHEPPPSKSLSETITDPFGSKAREEEQQRKTQEADEARLEAQLEKAEARGAIRAADERAGRAVNEAEDATAEAAKTKADAEKLMAEAKKAMADAEAKAKDAEQAKATAEARTQAADKAIAEAEAEKKAAQQAKQEAEQSETKAKAEKPEEGSKKAEAKKNESDTDKA